MKKKCAIGVDVGGSHVSSAAFDINSKKIIENSLSECDLDNQGTGKEIIKIWGTTIGKFMKSVDPQTVAGVGFAIPGPFDYENGIPLFTGANNKYEHIYGLNVPHELHKFWGLPVDFPIRFINDATAFAIGENWVGKTCGAKRSLAITLGTGFGSAFLKNSLPVVIGNEVPKNGCVWHLPFEKGIADDYFSTRGLIERYYTLTGIRVDGAKEIADIAGSSIVASELFIDFGKKLIVLLEPWLKKFGVEVIVIGGNISRASDLFLPVMKSTLEKKNMNIRVEISELKESASIIGSARLAEPEFWNKVSPLLKEM